MSEEDDRISMAASAIADRRVLGVLDAYHVRIAEERRVRAAEPERMRAPGWRDTQLLTVGQEVGQFLNLLAKSFTRPRILEIGTSYGYSGIWLAEAARATGGHLTTLELHDYKAAYARDMAMRAGLEAHVDFLVGDAVALIEGLEGDFDLILLDLWKDMYVPCLEAFYPRLNPGAVIVADNMIFPGGEEVARYGRAVRAKPGISSMLLTMGQGIEISRYDPPA
ncbi:MAG TPA: class I SAM-dependent methyltransferase [Sphingobium sp.]|nr:class I SAM-dependent methyltransferase [Sphingobium sp.]